jgi:hypothetical protein
MNTDKKCSKCLEVKDISNFTRPTGNLMFYCKLCTRKSATEWRSRNKERVAIHKRSYYLKYAERIKAKGRLYHKNNAEKIKARGELYRSKNKLTLRERKRLGALKWRHNNPHLAAAMQQKQRSTRSKRVPKWLNSLHYEEISKIYFKACQKSKQTGIKHQVDHIVPLRGKNVSGLHVPWNLQVIPALDNARKGNKF